MTSKLVVLRNSIWNWIYFVLNVAITFILSPILVHNLGDVKYGIWTTIISITGYYGLLDFGIRNALVRYVAKFESEKNKELLESAINTCFFLFLIIGIVILTTSVIITLSLDKLLVIGKDYYADAQLSLLIVGFTLAIQFPLNAFSGIIVGLQRYDISSKSWIISTSLQGILNFYFVTHGYGIVAISLINMICVTLAYTLMAIAGFNYISEIRIRLTLPKGDILKTIFSYSIFSFIIGLAGRIFNYTSPLIIGTTLTMSDVTYYAIPFTLISYANTVVNNFCKVLQPFASAMDANSNKHEIRNVSLWSIKICMLIYIPIAILSFTAGTDFISLWMGQIYGVHAEPILFMLTLAYFFVAFEMPLENMLIGMGHVKYLSIILLIEAISCVTLAFILVVRYGLVGVAIGVLIPIVIVRGVLIPVYGSNIIDLRIRKILLEGVTIPLLLSAPIVIVYKLFISGYRFVTYIELFCYTAYTIFAYIITFAIFTKDGRSAAKLIIDRYFRKANGN